ncbi:hypothetical protein SLS64_011651 [Diaporthe eres]|uniref:Uncharacterized protein n=1 Tax=Diaporthe eres TaxID=83184 RepID=A0ABR1P7Y0_DIAER
MKSTAAEIEAALANYRKVSAERYKRLPAVYIDATTKAEFTDKQIRKGISDEDYDKIAGLLGLDGTTCGNLLPESRAEYAASYFDALYAALEEKAPE